MRTLLLALLALTIYQSQLAAEMTVKEYKESLRSGAALTTKAYVAGVGVGLSWANTLAGERGVRLYCEPEKRAMTGSQYVDLLDKVIVAAGDQLTANQLDNLPIPALLLKGLQTTFPCPSTK